MAKTISFTRRQIQRAKLAELYDLYEEMFSHFYDSQFVEGRGSVTPKVVFVGEAPTAIDDKAQQAFAGQTGKTIKQLMRDAGLNPSDAFFTYYTKYKPPPKDGNPILNEMATCSHLMKRELAILGPTVVVPMGLNAISLFFEDKPHMDTMAGRVFRKRGYVILPMYHPAQVAYEDHVKAPTEHHFRVLREALKPDAPVKGTKSLRPQGTKSLPKKSLPQPKPATAGKSLRKAA